MAFNVEERYAAIGAGTAMVIPTAVDMAGFDDLIIDMADSVFEGDESAARNVTGLGFAVIGAGLIAAAIVTGMDDTTGVMAVGLGMGLLGIAARAYLEGGY